MRLLIEIAGGVVVSVRTDEENCHYIVIDHDNEEVGDCLKFIYWTCQYKIYCKNRAEPLAKDEKYLWID